MTSWLHFKPTVEPMVKETQKIPRAPTFTCSHHNPEKQGGRKLGTGNKLRALIMMVLKHIFYHPILRFFQ